MKNKVNKLSVIVPVYNEILVIEEFVTRLSNVLNALPVPYEVIFVDDNSNDGTYEFLSQLADNDAVFLLKKVGKKGKAFSLTEGFEKATGDILVMIDADLQYPPESISEMLKELKKYDVVVANRKKNDVSKTRKFASYAFKLLSGRILFGLPLDIQSGLKLFRREVIETIKYIPRSGWTFDLEFLHRAKEAGYLIGGVDIHFFQRARGNSKVNLFRSSIEIGINAFRVRVKKIYPMHIPSTTKNNMIGAGIGYKKKQFLTHSTLPHSKSAIRTFEAKQILFFFLVILFLGVSFSYQPLETIKYFVAILSIVYFLDVLFNFYLIGKSLYSSKELSFTGEQIASVDETLLPLYTILCPLYKEAHIIPHFLDSISKLDYPKDKLDVMLLLEEDDTYSIESVKEMELPSYVRVVVVPHSMPKTKPKACNYGLSLAKGEYLVIYDAEDMPDPLQLKKAILGFAKVDDKTVCLQAKLNYYNPNQNLLTRFFTAEYSLWFDLTLTGLQTLDTSLPLGGTSNHFKVAKLLALHGWDAFNVTEDADLGIRLFKEGYKTAMIDSTTLEEANSQYKNWIRQRSRWIKGYMQTYIVHMRQFLSFAKTQKHHAVYFQLLLGGKIAFILINPLLWIATISYFALYSLVGPTIESLYPPVIFYMAVTSLVFGNFLFIYYYMIGCLKREQYGLIKFVYLVPFYWIMISIAGAMAFYQLLFKPHYWEKTVHGLHLKNKAEVKTPEVIPYVEENSSGLGYSPSRRSRLDEFIRGRRNYISGATLIMASVLANVVNLIFNVYLGRTIELSNLALVSLVNSLLYLFIIQFSALSSTVNSRSAFLFGRYGDFSSFQFWRSTRLRTFFIASFITILWIISANFLRIYFNRQDILPFLLFAPLILTGFLSAIDSGYLYGKLLFGYLAFLAVFEPVAKFLVTFLLISINKQELAYLAIPVSAILTFFVGWLFILRLNKKFRSKVVASDALRFPKKFFVASVLSGLSTMTFLSLDILLVNHFLSAKDAALYTLVSLIGKMIYFLGSLGNQFVVPIVSFREGKKQNSRMILYLLLLFTSFLSVSGFFVFGIFGNVTLPFIFGDRALSVLPYIVFFSFAMLTFTISRVFVSYYLARKIYTFSVAAFLLAILQIALIAWNHSSINAVISAMILVGGSSFVVMTALHINNRYVRIFESNIADLFALFDKSISQENNEKLRILIYNWRDTHHKWAGGAEVYAQKIAERFVKKGNNVTIFCGNDGFSPKNQVINGVAIKRRGGTYTVYLWAFLYYILKFRGNFDVIIDCENGIPFFTPLYARIPAVLLIHHIHQEVFREHLWFPFAKLASFLEGKAMPVIYKNHQVITVSESSKKAIVDIKMAKQRQISIVHNGIEHDRYVVGSKTKYPLFSYLGRLKPYKNVDVALRAFAKIAAIYKDAIFVVMGTGESLSGLISLSRKLGIENRVVFTGKVSEEIKAHYLSKSWAVLQPSMIEGWGITVIEANASGTPVIASNVSGLCDAVVHKKTGILVKVHDDDEVAKAMNTLILNVKYRKSLSKEAFIWSKKFSWDMAANEFMKNIESYIVENQNYKYRGTVAVT